MGILINHAHYTRITGVGRTSIPISRPTASRNITTILQSGAWLGQKALLLGGGPSMMGLRFDSMSVCPKIGVNKAFVDYPVNVNYCMDSRFYEELSFPQKADPKNAGLRQSWSNFAGIKVFLKLDKDFKFGPEVYTVENVPHKSISYDLLVGIYGGRNSGFGAMMLAIALGCTKIGLLGYDMKVDKTRRKTHYHDGYSHQKVRSIEEELESMQNKLDGFREEFEEFADNIKQNGIEVYNLNRDSALNCFPKVNMDEFAKM